MNSNGGSGEAVGDAGTYNETHLRTLGARTFLIAVWKKCSNSGYRKIHWAQTISRVQHQQLQGLQRVQHPQLQGLQSIIQSHMDVRRNLCFNKILYEENIYQKFNAFWVQFAQQLRRFPHTNRTCKNQFKVAKNQVDRVDVCLYHAGKLPA